MRGWGPWNVAGAANTVSPPRDLSNRLTVGSALDSLSIGFDKHSGCARVENSPTSPAGPPAYPGARRPHRPQRLRALASGRTDTMIASAASSKRTPSTMGAPIRTHVPT